MSLAIRSTVVAICLLAGAAALAQDGILWAPNLEQAQRAATEQRKLLLLHFYNDNCAPCERLEANVFNQPKVAAAINNNYIPVKIHAGTQTRVAEHYRVDRWPTDVVCTASGLEIYRTISPGTPERYIELCDAVAMQAGVGAGRQWATAMQTAGQQVVDAAAAQAQGVGNQVAATAQETAGQATGQVTDAANQYLAQANSTFQGYAARADQQVTTATQQVNQAAEQATQTTQQVQAKTQDWTRRIGDTAGQLGAVGQQFGQAAQTTARDLRTTWDATSLRTQLPYGGAPPAATGPAGATSGSIYGPAPTTAESALPTNNPWIGQQTDPNAANPGSANPVLTAPPPAVAAAIATIRGEQTPAANAAPPAGSALIANSTPNTADVSTSIPPAANVAAQIGQGIAPDRQMVQASQAPPVALEGYCPVTLLDARKWQKSDVKFGAIHRGRTYLFRSAAEQSKFLADPDRYSPVLSGLDPVVFATRGEQIEGKRSYGLTYNRQIYLFADKASLEAFERSPQAYAQAAHTAMMQAETAPKYR
jgi:YHS domain-containing protein